MLGYKIKTLRIKNQLTQKQLADKLGLAQSTIGMIESGKRDVSFEILIKIADLFNVSTDYLTRKSAKAVIEDKLEELNMTFEELSDKTKIPMVFFDKLDDIIPYEGDYERIQVIARALNIEPIDLANALHRQEPPITYEKLDKWDKKYNSRDLSEKANYIELGKVVEECRKYKEYSITNLVSRIAQDDNKRKKIEKIIYDLEHYNWTKEKLSKPDLIELLSKIATETNTSYPATFEKYVDKIYADIENENQIREDSAPYNTGGFTTPEAAMQFILKQPAVMGFGGFDVNKMRDEEIIEFANELLNQLKLISYKYKK
ncbi:helix-turn-helix domain-containing protein [Clostridium peptidivorans]|uniref:helix-turn-helix domain-containing protein n=1 Tax=Clostridium peptidivorans TaxID=100174 RepID=UPI003BFA6EA4